jgi:hypothetical protein
MTRNRRYPNLSTCCQAFWLLENVILGQPSGMMHVECPQVRSDISQASVREFIEWFLVSEAGKVMAACIPADNPSPAGRDGPQGRPIPTKKTATGRERGYDTTNDNGRGGPRKRPPPTKTVMAGYKRHGLGEQRPQPREKSDTWDPNPRDFEATASILAATCPQAAENAI